MNPLPPPGTRVAIYARGSTDMQSPKSTEDQTSLCRVFAQRHGWVVVGHFVDDTRGRNHVAREDFWEMMAGARQGAFTVILVEDLNRLAVGALQVRSIAQELDSLGIIISPIGTHGAAYARYSTDKQEGLPAVGE